MKSANRTQKNIEEKLVLIVESQGTLWNSCPEYIGTQRDSGSDKSEWDTHWDTFRNSGCIGPHG